MSISNNKFTYLHYVIVGLWLISVVFFAKYFMQQRATEFDPKGQLSNVNNETLLATVLSDYSSLSIPTKTLFHISNDDCKCNLVTNNHMNSVFSLAKNNEFTVVNLPLTQQMKQIIPSTPAVLVTDENGDLLYFGPYGQGVSCSASNGIIDMVLQNFFNGFKFSSIHSKATGCYCNLS